MAEALREPGALPLKVRHVRDHGHRIPGGRERLRVERGVLAGANERLLGQGAAQEGRHGVGDLVCRATQSRVLEMAGLGERRGRPFTEQLAYPQRHRRLRLCRLLVLVEQRGILVARQQPEERAVGELVAACGQRVAQLHQPPVLRHGPDFLDAVLHRWRQPQQVATPDAVVLLLLEDGGDDLRLHQRLLLTRELLGRGVANGCKLGQGAIPDRLVAVLEQPRQRDPVGSGQIHGNSILGRWPGTEGQNGREYSP